VLGGISPIDPSLHRNMKAPGVLDHVDAVAVHGFPLDWNLWQIDEWPAKLARSRGDRLPVWVTEVGVSSFGAEEVQAWGLRAPPSCWPAARRASTGTASTICRRAWEATTRHKEAEGSSYYRHFHMGCCARTARRSSRWSFCRTRRDWASASGFTSRITGSTTRCAGCGGSACGISHRPVLGRQLPAERARLVRPADGGARRIRGHRDVLLHARASRHRAASHQRAAGAGGVRRILRPFPVSPTKSSRDCANAGRLPGILGNCHASGTEIIARFGDEHIRSGKPICYTSADSVFQIAAHEQEFGLERLYAVCEIARELLEPLNIGRVIARPFRGSRSDYLRTHNRRDYAVPPPDRTILDLATEDRRDVVTHRQDRRHFRAPRNGPGLEGRRQRRAVRSHAGGLRFSRRRRTTVCQLHRLRFDLRPSPRRGRLRRGARSI
jgi:hypothetical protein